MACRTVGKLYPKNCLGNFASPRHPNTLWAGVWTPKHLLRRLLGVPNTYSPRYLQDFGCLGQRCSWIMGMQGYPPNDTPPTLPKWSHYIRFFFNHNNRPYFLRGWGGTLRSSWLEETCFLHLEQCETKPTKWHEPWNTGHRSVKDRIQNSWLKKIYSWNTTWYIPYKVGPY